MSLEGLATAGRGAREASCGVGGRTAIAEALKTGTTLKPRVSLLGPYLQELIRGEHKNTFIRIFITDEKWEISRMLGNREFTI